jgi:hypothetical protein
VLGIGVEDNSAKVEKTASAHERVMNIGSVELTGVFRSASREAENGEKPTIVTC